MANKELQEWIREKIQDKNSGSHQKVKIWNPETKSYKEADWLWTFPNKSAIIIEDKEEGDSGLKNMEHGLELAKKQIEERYIPALKAQGFTDFIYIVAKDNGTTKNVRVFRNGKLISEELETLEHYKHLLNAIEYVDLSASIFNITSKINQLLHDNFKIENLVNRMIFTGCILITSNFSKGKIDINSYEGIDGFKTIIKNKITDKFSKPEIKAAKIEQLTTQFSNINISPDLKKSDIDMLVNYSNQIVDLIQANPKSNIDIMNIFFTEFNRYRKNPEHGQVFTPDHISTLMAKLLRIVKDDHVLDPTCGSGALLVKAADELNSNWNNVYGNDYYMDVLRLAYVNMLLHQDGITNLKNYDATSRILKYEKKDDLTFAQWVINNKITKVIANPPYEANLTKDILMNLLENVEDGCRFAWLMPNNKMDKLFGQKYDLLKPIKQETTLKNGKIKVKEIKQVKCKDYFLENNSLTDIIYLGDIFAGFGTGGISIFIYEKGVPQGTKKIHGWFIEDGFETVKNKGYQDVKGKWPKIESDFLNAFNKPFEELTQEEKDKFQIIEIDPTERLSYPVKVVLEPVKREEFESTLLQYKLFETGEISSQNTVQSVIELMLKFANKAKEENNDD